MTLAINGYNGAIFVLGEMTLAINTYNGAIFVELLS